MPSVRKAVITAAGRGTRQYPASTAVQKELFPLVDRDGLTKPVIQIIAEEALDAGIEEICIVTAPGQSQLYRDYFRHPPADLARSLHNKDWALLQAEKLADLGKRLSFAEQPTPEGFGHAVYQARDFVGTDPFLLLLGDHVYISDTIDRCARQLLTVFGQHQPAAATAVQLTQERDLHLFGTILGSPIQPPSAPASFPSPSTLGEGRGEGSSPSSTFHPPSSPTRTYRADLIVEKPSIDFARTHLATPGLPFGNYLAHFGMHVFSPAIFDALHHLIASNKRENNEFQLTSAQEFLRQRTNNYLVTLIQGHRYDTGIPYGLMETQLALALTGVHRTEILESLTRILSSQRRT